jgi:cell division protein FtsQ
MPERPLRLGRGRRLEPEELTRRRFARRQWARRWLVWRVLLAVLLLLAAVAATAWAVFFSSLLAVKGVEVTGTSLLTERQVLRAAQVETGIPLARADLDGIAARIEALAPVAQVDVSRQWPDQVRVEIIERVPVAVVEEGGRLRGMDAEGRLFRDFRKAPPSLPRVVMAPDTREEALREAASVVGVLPPRLARRVDHVDVRTVDHIALELGDGRTVVWGSAEQSYDKARVLEALLETDPDSSRYDVSVPGQPTVKR